MAYVLLGLFATSSNEVDTYVGVSPMPGIMEDILTMVEFHCIVRF